jgi:hypothetical protein
MRFNFSNYVLRNEDDGSGGGAAGLDGDVAPADIVTPPPAEQPPEGSSDTAAPAWAKDLGLDADILGDPSLKAITDLNSLAKSYVHAQRKIGQKGVIIPSENSTKEEWDTFYQKVGVPLDDKAYVEKVKLPSKEDGAQFNEEFNSEFIKKTHELRVKPEQASKMYEFFNEKAKTQAESFKQEMETQAQEGLNKLRDTYGEDAYNVKLSKAVKLAKEEVGEDFIGYLKETGLGKNPKVVDALIKLADKFYSEDPLPKGHSTAATSKQDAEREINRAMGDFDDPYHKSNHPDHKRRVEEIQKFFAILEK